METENIYQEMNNNNFRSLSEGLKLVRKENTANAENIIKLESTISQLQSQIQILQSQNAVVMAKAFGSGATS